MSYKTAEQTEKLKDLLWTAIDNLEEEDGFVLVASGDEIQFTALHSGGWDEHVLELEPLVELYNQAESQRQYERIKKLKLESGKLTSTISRKRKELAVIKAAVRKATL